ncbi:MAG: hypothetical protein CM15mP70_13540 [Pelagibacteraceae bacterium]|nr:MAG: hypothetical protein CM15mP70_13540 [Pelagibacteraceae bacterium]
MYRETSVPGNSQITPKEKSPEEERSSALRRAL